MGQNMNGIRALVERFVLKKSERTTKAVKNILISIVAKSVSIITPLLIVPLTISYINPIQYGIWLTLSSIINWIAVMDLGLGHGFRNMFAVAVANNDLVLAKKYTSTTYCFISLLMIGLYVILLLVNRYINWPLVLKVEDSYQSELHQVVIIVCFFFCLRMIVNLFGTLLTANQQPGYNSLIIGISDIASLLGIFILTRVSNGSLINLALYYSGIPCLVMLLISVIAFIFTEYKLYAPSLKYIDFSLIKNVFSLGVQFFVINMCLIAIFQVINFVLSREIGPLAVTQYNVTHKYYGMLYAFVIVIITPFWSAFTDAYTKKDYAWMKSILVTLERFWVVVAIIGVIMFMISPFFYKIWLKDEVEISSALSLSMLLFILSQSLGGIYMMLINGIGKIRIQLFIYIAFALVSWPLLSLSCRFWGVSGILLVPSMVYFTQAFLGRIQLKKILSQKAFGIWNR